MKAKHGGRRVGAGRKATALDMEKVRALRAEGKSVAGVAAALQVNKWAVRYQLIKEKQDGRV